jgi:hypothetical protein
LKAICDRLSDVPEFSKKILSYLGGEFEKVKLSASTPQLDKLKMLRLVCAASNFTNSDADAYAATVVEFTFGLKEQTDIDKDI